MRRSLLLLVAFIAACASPAPDAVDPAPVVVEEWLNSIDDNDYEAATGQTYEPAMAIVIAVENGLDTADTAALLNDGIPPAMSASYWSSFRTGFGAFAGFDLSDLGVDTAEPIFAEGVQFAAVSVDDNASGSGLIFTRDAAEREIDLVATLAPGFVDQLLNVYRALPADDDGDVVRTAYMDTVVPAMWAAISSERHDDEFNRRALALIDSVDTDSSPSP